MRRKRDTNIDEAARRYDLGAPDSETVIKDNLAEIGRRLVERESEKYRSVGPELTAGDLDARWQEAEDSGAETPGGHVATPDQDNVDEIGRAVGMEFQDNQELSAPEEILSRRDRRRWEMDKRSADGESL
jgi:erythromycin esterase-like protein